MTRFRRTALVSNNFVLCCDFRGCELGKKRNNQRNLLRPTQNGGCLAYTVSQERDTDTLLPTCHRGRPRRAATGALAARGSSAPRHAAQAVGRVSGWREGCLPPTHLPRCDPSWSSSRKTRKMLLVWLGQRAGPELHGAMLSQKGDAVRENAQHELHDTRL